MKGFRITAILLAITVGACELVGHRGKNQNDVDLVGVTWKLSSVEKGTVKSDKGCVDITLAFTEEGDVRGESERNSYFGLYQLGHGDSLSVRGTKGRYLGSTRAGEPSCSRYEEHLLALSTAQSYEIDGKRLKVRCGDGILLHYDME